MPCGGGDAARRRKHFPACLALPCSAWPCLALHGPPLPCFPASHCSAAHCQMPGAVGHAAGTGVRQLRLVLAVRGQHSLVGGTAAPAAPANARVPPLLRRLPPPLDMLRMASESTSWRRRIHAAIACGSNALFDLPSHSHRPWPDLPRRCPDCIAKWIRGGSTFACPICGARMKDSTLRSEVRSL